MAFNRKLDSQLNDSGKHFFGISPCLFIRLTTMSHCPPSFIGSWNRLILQAICVTMNTQHNNSTQHTPWNNNKCSDSQTTDRLCGLVVRVLGYRSGDPGSIPGTTRFSEKAENTAVGIRHADHVAPSIRKSWQSLRRQATVARSV
jgi:hypothetical protein